MLVHVRLLVVDMTQCMAENSNQYTCWRTRHCFSSFRCHIGCQVFIQKHFRHASVILRHICGSVCCSLHPSPQDQQNLAACFMGMSVKCLLSKTNYQLKIDEIQKLSQKTHLPTWAEFFFWNKEVPTSIKEAFISTLQPLPLTGMWWSGNMWPAGPQQPPKAWEEKTTLS